MLANWITTGDALWKTLPAGYWPVAGLDLALIVTATIAMLAARTLRRRELGRHASDRSGAAQRGVGLEATEARNA